MGELASELQRRKKAEENAIKEKKILESIPECAAQLESLRDVYGHGGDARRQFARLNETLRDLGIIQSQLQARRDELDLEIQDAQRHFENLCAQVGNQVDGSMIVNPESVKDDVFNATRQLGVLRNGRQVIAASLDQCAADMHGTSQALEMLKRQRQLKVSTALQMVARLSEILASIEDLNEINYEPMVNPTLSVDEYSMQVKNQPRNATTIDWAQSTFDDAMQRVELKKDAELREAAASGEELQPEGVVPGDGYDMFNGLVVSQGMWSLLSGNET